MSRLSTVVLGFALAVLTAVSAEAAEASFDQLFSAAHEPTTLHYRVQFRSGDGPHALEVWRQGDRRLKRATDRAIVTHAAHRPGTPGYEMVILDLKRRISTHIDRTNLYRIGSFTDWFDLGHGLRHPAGRYRITPTKAPAGILAPLRPCRWYALTQRAQTSRICWDRSYAVPMLIVAGDGSLLWRVTEIDTRPIAHGVFQIAEKGFIRNDANRDISGD